MYIDKAFFQRLFFLFISIIVLLIHKNIQSFIVMLSFAVSKGNMCCWFHKMNKKEILFKKVFSHCLNQKWITHWSFYFLLGQLSLRKNHEGFQLPWLCFLLVFYKYSRFWKVQNTMMIKWTKYLRILIRSAFMFNWQLNIAR